jgi:hypothetical protein
VLADNSGSARRDAPAAFTNLRDWVLSLPWVIERRFYLGTPALRAFAIDCEPLARRQMWLITGLRRGYVDPAGDVAVILPSDIAEAVEAEGLALPLVPMPRGNMLVVASDETATNPRAVEALVLRAYGHAMA